MRFARKLFLLAIMAMAAMAMAAPAASAQSVEVRTEPGGAHLAAPAPIHAEGTITLAGHVFGIEAVASTCHIEFSGNVNEDGVGSVTQALHTGADCTKDPCTATGGGITPWPVTLEEEAGQIILHAEFCVINKPPSSPGTPTRCLVETAVSPEANGHNYVISYNDTGGVAHSGPRCELTGSIGIEYGTGFPAIELRHTTGHGS